MFDFGLRIRELRENRNMTQEALGRRVGRSKPVISSYENNLKTPTLDVLISIANVFNVSLDYLVGIEKKQTLNISELTDPQIQILKTIVDEFSDKSVYKNGLSVRQQNILNMLLVEFFKNR